MSTGHVIQYPLAEVNCAFAGIEIGKVCVLRETHVWHGYYDIPNHLDAQNIAWTVTVKYLLHIN